MAKKRKDLSKNPTRGEIQRYAIDAENKSKRIISIVSTLIIWSVIGYVFYRITSCVEVLAGKQTFADINIDAGLKVSIITKVIPWFVGISGVTYGLVQRSLKKRNIMKNHDHIEKLEKKINEKRKSSRLTSKGETRREDKI